ncbi:MAG: LysM peptidoglycan-binding domain-containing protein [Chitinophagaceae bacterium]|nr:MAG: LysM peptidoglycan-binding domain-containing protein [Chitinophagaceae bacterium]
MKKRRLAILIATFFSAGQLLAQSKATIQAYIDKYKDIAIEEMQRTGVPAAITLAQGIHETGAGTSDLVTKSNNHFGIKCKTEWEGEKVYHDDDARGECFRKYDDPTISYRDHSDFLRNRPYYASLFKLDPTDYESWAYGLKKAGYATNPKYPQILIKLIRDYNLQDYTLVALGRKQLDPNSPQWVKNADESSNMALGISGAMKVEAKKNYPEGVFKINDTKVIFIQKGTSYLKIAEENNMPLARLLDFNDMRDGDVALNDQLLFLQRKRKTGETEVHTVLPGETLYDIAQAEGIRLENLLQYNYLTPNVQPEVGEKLFLTKSAPNMPKLANEKAGVVMASFKTTEPVKEVVMQEEAAFISHTVQPKETLFSIAKKYNVAVDDVRKWNALGTNDLRIGQELRINKATNANR